MTNAVWIPFEDDASARIRGRVERSLQAVIARLGEGGCPPRLREAIAHAVLGGGQRLRPGLCVAVAEAHGDPDPGAADRAAVAVELVHCASLVHDDLPCFDDAATRRGRESVHRRFGQPLAILAGDALIVHAFEMLAPARTTPLVGVLARATGATRGIIAGQAWESEPAAPLDEYQRAKTASLFAASASMGAAVAGAPVPAAWAEVGELVGRAYQAADDLLDAIGAADAGKPVGRDEALDRPSVVRTLGIDAARQRVRSFLQRASALVPSCPNDGVVRGWLDDLSARLERL